jgi:hypothetical protein
VIAKVIHLRSSGFGAGSHFISLDLFDFVVEQYFVE